MLNNATIAQLRSLKLVGFADALQQQHEQADCLNLSFDERLALLVEREVYARSDRKRARLLQQAQLKYPSATLEDASFEGIRGLDRPALMGLALSTWIERGETVTLAGATGLGKTWLACALGALQLVPQSLLKAADVVCTRGDGGAVSGVFHPCHLVAVVGRYAVGGAAFSGLVALERGRQASVDPAGSQRRRPWRCNRRCRGDIFLA